MKKKDLLQLALSQKTKTELFIEELLKNKGNATEAAMIVFNCSSRESAQAMGSYYLKKAKPLVRAVLEQQGYTYGKMIEIAIQKMEESKTPEWWDRLMSIAQYENVLR